MATITPATLKALHLSLHPSLDPMNVLGSYGNAAQLALVVPRSDDLYLSTIISLLCDGHTNRIRRGGDFHFAVDGNFGHRHRKSAGDSPPFQDPSYFVPKTLVDSVGDRIEAQRKVRPKVYKPKVPDEAIDGCMTSHDAANENKKHLTTDVFDDTGLMALVCRHDIPLFFANIDTPGEQQKYAVALIEYLFSLLPPQGTAVGLYDVGCVLDRSLAMVISSNGLSTTPAHIILSSMTSFPLQLQIALLSQPVLCMHTPMSGRVNLSSTPVFALDSVSLMVKVLNAYGRVSGSWLPYVAPLQYLGRFITCSIHTKHLIYAEGPKVMADRSPSCRNWK
jgi:hypothetical protein